MLLKELLQQNIAKRILLSFFLFSFVVTAISIAVILYSQYSKEKVEVVSETKAQINSRVEFIGEVLWNIDKPLAELSIKSLADNPDVSYIAIFNENKDVFTSVGDKNSSFYKSVEIPLNRIDKHNNKSMMIGTLVANISTASAEQHVKDNFVNILLVQTFKSVITSFVFLFLIYNILVKHLNKITQGIITNSKMGVNNDDLIELKRKPRNDELQLLTDTLNKNKIARNKHLTTLKVGRDKLVEEVEIRKAAEQKAVHSHDELLYVLNSLTTAVYYCKSDGEVMFMNHKALNLLSQHDSILSTTGKMPQYLDHIVRFNEENNFTSKSHDLKLYANSSKFISSLNAFHMSNDGQELLTPVELTIIPTKQNITSLEPNFIVVVKDKSGEAKLEEMSYLVSHDYLTKIYNRMYLTEKLEEVIEESEGTYSLAVLDLDEFKVVNDTAGHQAGDRLLKMATEAISNSIGQNDIFARIGGDEFAVLFKLSEEDSVQKAFQIITDIEAINFVHNDVVMPISCSVGITGLREDDTKTEAVMARADKACYRVKRNGKGSVLTDRDKIEYLQPAQVAL